MKKINLKRLTQKTILNLIAEDRFSKSVKHLDYETFYPAILEAARTLDGYRFEQRFVNKYYFLQLNKFYKKYKILPRFFTIESDDLPCFDLYLEKQILIWEHREYQNRKQSLLSVKNISKPKKYIKSIYDAF